MDAVALAVDAVSRTVMRLANKKRFKKEVPSVFRITSQTKEIGYFTVINEGAKYMK